MPSQDGFWNDRKRNGRTGFIVTLGDLLKKKLLEIFKIKFSNLLIGFKL